MPAGDSEPRKLEQKAIIETLAFITYNPSIGRVLKKGGVRVFERMAYRQVKKLRKIKRRGAFDKFHAEWMRKFRNRIRASGGKQGKRCSYGQAQKPINVYLKVYVDHAGLPDECTAERLRPFLHVPLDSLLMKTVRKWSAAHEEKAPSKPKNPSISHLDKRTYDQWQKFFRDEHREKPVRFDLVWWLARTRKRHVAATDRQINQLLSWLCRGPG